MTNEPTEAAVPEPIDPVKLRAWCDVQDTTANEMLGRWGQVDPSRLLEATAIIRRLLDERVGQAKPAPAGGGSASLTVERSPAPLAIKMDTSAVVSEKITAAATASVAGVSNLADAMKRVDRTIIDALMRETNAFPSVTSVSPVSTTRPYQRRYDWGDGGGYGMGLAPDSWGMSARLSRGGEVRVKMDRCPEGVSDCQSVTITVVYAHASTAAIRRLEELMRSGELARFIEGRL